MLLKKFNSLSLLLPLLLLFPWNAAAAGPRVNKASQRNLRLSSPVAAVVSDLSAAALSSTSINWYWSTGSYTGIDGFYLHSSSTAVKITLSSSTAFYTDTGLAADTAYTRWITAYQGADEGGDSPHMQKFTYAMPPAAIAISTDAPTASPTVNSLTLPWARRTDTVVSTSAYAEIPPAYWFPNPVHASAYAVECSTDGGTTYVRNRTFFVPWETFPVLSNSHYMVRLGAVNGDDELTPGVYSATRTFTTPPLTPSTFTAVAISSYSIQWLWDKDMFAGTGITGFNVYHSTLSAEDSIPADSDNGVILATLGLNTSYWTEVYVDSVTLVANSRHTRWLKAFGYLESEKSPVRQKYTYATAPASTTVVWIDPDPYWVAHVEEESLSLHWPTQGASTVIFSGDWRPGIATQYVIDRSTTAGFTVAVTSATVGAPPQSVTGLTNNTKYDLRIGAVNGDGEQTPANAPNPFAYSQAYKAMTRPGPVTDFSFAPWTDTAMHCAWSTAAYTHPEYISGYVLGDKHIKPDGTAYWDPVDTLTGVTSNQYNLDYLMTNSTHTITIWVNQQDPDAAPGDPAYYNNFGSYGRDTDGYTFATPPNDVSFYEVRSSTIGITWNEPIVPATKYRVERSTSLNGPEAQRPWVFVSSVAGNTFEDTGLTPYTTYSYRIGAINLLGFQTVGMSTNTDGHRRDYGFVSSTLTKHISPTMLGTATSTNAINWAWTNTVPGVLSYNLYTSSDGIIVTGLGAATTFYVEVNLSSANARHTRRVRSYTSFGEGDYSQAAVSTLANPPAAPVITSSGVHNMALEWLDSDGSTRYKLDRSTDNNSWTPLKTWTDIYVSTGFNDTGLSFAATYYYAVSGYNYDGIVSVSSSISAANMTLPLPAAYTAVFATAAVSQNVTAPITGVGLVTVTVPVGAPDGYFFISTSAFASPADITKADLDAATAKLTSVSLLTGSIVELHLYDIYGSSVSSNLPSSARISMIYTDANNDDIVDGTSAQAVSLRLFSLDTGALVWNQIANSILDNGANTVYADVPHFSFYALGSVTSAAGTIADVFAYPNPYKPGSSGVFGQSVYGEGIVFESLPAGSEVRIFSLAGGLVRELTDSDGDGRCLWDARNADGARAASGTYVYLVTSPAGGKKSGRIAIIK